MATQADDREFKPRLAILSSSKFLCKIIFEIYHKFHSEEKIFWENLRVEPTNQFTDMCRDSNPLLARVGNAT